MAVSEQEEKTGFRQEFEAHLNSPLTILMRLRNFIFGTKIPDTYTKFSFFLALAGWAIFMLWSVIGTVVIRMRDLIVDNKEIDVTALIEARGIALGFEPGIFIGRLEAFYALSIVCWTVVFIGLVLLWRKNELFFFVYFTGCGCYLLLMWTILGFGYYSRDTTFFDKIAFAAVAGHTAVYAYFLKREKNGNKVRLFGIEDDNKPK